MRKKEMLKLRRKYAWTFVENVREAFFVDTHNQTLKINALFCDVRYKGDKSTMEKDNKAMLDILYKSKKELSFKIKNAKKKHGLLSFIRQMEMILGMIDGIKRLGGEEFVPREYRG